MVAGNAWTDDRLSMAMKRNEYFGDVVDLDMICTEARLKGGSMECGVLCSNQKPLYASMSMSVACEDLSAILKMEVRYILSRRR